MAPAGCLRLLGAPRPPPRLHLLPMHPHCGGRGMSAARREADRVCTRRYFTSLADLQPPPIARAAEFLPDRTDVQCLHRWQKVLNPELVKGPWTKQVRHDGVWGGIPADTKTRGEVASFGRAQPGAQPPNPLPLKHQEDDKITQLVATYGAGRWSLIAKELPGRIGKQCRER